jgi:hypothetical protein
LTAAGAVPFTEAAINVIRRSGGTSLSKNRDVVLGGRRYRRHLATMIVAVATMLGAVVTWGQPAEAALVSHVCGNPSRTYNGGRAGLCADLHLDSVSVPGTTLLRPGGQFFCQVASGDFHIIPCAGAAWGVDLYIRRPGEPSFTQFIHTRTHTCGTFNNRPDTITHGACRRGRLEVQPHGTIVGPIPTEPRCSFYYARARASFQLPGDPTAIEGVVLTSGIWQDPICKT